MLIFFVKGENFHEFSCGNLIKTLRIPDEHSRVDVFDTLRESLAFNVADLLSQPINEADLQSINKAKKLYASCLDEGKVKFP